MNKKGNTVLFILGATLVNLLIMLILLGVGMVLVSFILRGAEPRAWGALLIGLVFCLSLLGAFFLYNRLIRALSRKVDFDRYFAPLIGSRFRKK